MNLLLDTHCLLWWLSDDAQLDASARRAIAEPSNTVFLSAVVLWEIRIKQGIGKLTLPRDFRGQVDAEGFVELPVTLDQVDRLLELPPIHRDPFDRLLIAQALQSQLTLVTNDRRIREYDVSLFPAS